MKSMMAASVMLLAWLGPAALADERPQREPEAWLGVQLSPVPSALVSHLKLEDEGVMIRNVFRDSPASDAHLERYDVIIAVDGDAVEGGVEAFRDHVLDRKSGDELRLDLYRRGEQRTVTVTLGHAPDEWARLELKYEDEPDLTQWHGLGLRGRILRPGPQGWVIEDLGEAPWLRDLPDWFEKELDEHRLGGAGNELTESRRIDSEGHELTVRRMPDGSVEVRREVEAEDGTRAEVKTYQSMDELKEADREAYDLLHSDRGWDRHRDMFLPRHPGRDWTTPGPPMSERWREWNDRFFRGPMEERELLRRLDRDDEMTATRPAERDRPTTRFETHEDGRISVHVRRGDTELSTTYPSADQLQQEAPGLFERYRDIQDALK